MRHHVIHFQKSGRERPKFPLGRESLQLAQLLLFASERGHSMV
jgi:hypothetical protein